MTEQTQDVEQLLDEYVTIWNEKEYGKLPDVAAESISLYDPGVPEGEVHGRDEFEAQLRELHAGIPDFTVTLEDMLVGDGIVMAEWTVTGTHEGEFHGIPPTEREIELQGMDKLLISDGNVQEHRIYYDQQELLEQLGVTDE